MEEFDPSLCEIADGSNEVVGGDGEVLYACSFEVVQVFLDLGFSSSLCRLVDWELYSPGLVLDHLGS